jgi:hypothetical protein
MINKKIWQNIAQFGLVSTMTIAGLGTSFKPTLAQNNGSPKIKVVYTKSQNPNQNLPRKQII